MGREAEVVVELLAAFRERHPGVQVRVQQLPWTAAHEKLLTAFAGVALPDLCQLGNTWLPEFSAIGALGAARRAAGRPPASRATTTSPASSTPISCRRPMVRPGFSGCRGTSTRACLFYRSDLLRAAGHARPPQTWDEWRAAMRDIRRLGPAALTARCCPSTSRIRCSHCPLQQGPVLGEATPRRLLAAAVPARARLLRRLVP
jgi:multiple sugar transport system substrate-binding protein